MGKICLVTTLPLTFDAWGMYTCTCLGGAVDRRKPVKSRLQSRGGGSYVVQFSYLCTFRRAPSCVCFIHDTAFCGVRTRLFFPWDGCLTLCSGGILFTTGTAIQDVVFSSLFSLWPQALLTAHYSNPPLETTSFCFLMGFSIALMTIVSKCLVKIN